MGCHLRPYCARQLLLLLCRCQREEGNHALRWSSLASPWNPLHPSSLGLVARFAVTRGQPLDPAEEHSPSDSLFFFLVEEGLNRVRYALR
jgi:hypothetical protein